MIHNKNWRKILHGSIAQFSIYCFPSHLKETKLCRTQTSLDSFNCMYNKKAHMLNICYRLKTINFLKTKRVVLKHGVPIGIP